MIDCYIVTMIDLYQLLLEKNEDVLDKNNLKVE